MNDKDNLAVLEERFDGMAYVLMALIADLENGRCWTADDFVARCGRWRPRGGATVLWFQH